MTKVTAQLEGQDFISGEKLAPGRWRIKAKGCQHFLNQVRAMLSQNSNPETWTLPPGKKHSDLLLKEFILKIKGEWAYPYLHEEICHCRNVATLKVDQSIMNGAHTPTRVSRETSASTACGTCRTDVEAILKLRVG